jgi:cytochrome c oxidase cbb3-type subunit 4
VTKLQEYFNTDWSAMTGIDWFGLVLTVVVFILMVVVYYWALNPKNKQELESHRTMLMNDDDMKSEK